MNNGVRDPSICFTLSQIQPGLGLSEVWYTVIVSVQSLGELTGAVIMGTLSRWVYTKVITLISLAICFTGALLYGIGKAGWMLLVGELWQRANLSLLQLGVDVKCEEKEFWG